MSALDGDMLRAWVRDRMNHDGDVGRAAWNRLAREIESGLFDVPESDRVVGGRVISGHASETRVVPGLNRQPTRDADPRPCPSSTGVRIGGGRAPDRQGWALILRATSYEAAEQLAWAFHMENAPIIPWPLEDAS